jgi:hypothetical protein
MLDMEVTDLGPTQLKNIERSIRVYSLQVGVPAKAKPAPEAKPPEPKKRSRLALMGAGIAALLILLAAGAWYFVAANRPAPVASNALRRLRPRAFPSSCCRSPISPAIRRRITSPTL